MPTVDSTAPGEPKGNVMRLALTPEQFNTLRERAGIAESSTSGEINQQGVRAQWSYADGMLQATILHKPMFATEGMIESHFRKWAGLPAG